MACAATAAVGVGLALSAAGLLLLDARGAADAWNVSRAEMFGVGAAGAVVSLFCLRLLRGFEKDRIWYLVLSGFLCSAVATMVMILLPEAASPEGLAATPAGERLEHLYANLVRTGDAFNILLAIFLAVVVTMFFVLGCLVLGFGFPTWLWAMAAVRDREHPQARAAVTAAFATTMLQVGLWVLLVPLLGMAALLYMHPAASDNPLFSRVWTRFAFNLGLAGLLIGPALYVTYRRWGLAKPFFQRGPREDPPPIPRLIAHPALLTGLFVASLVGQATFVHSMWTDNDWLNELLRGIQWYFVGGGLFVLALAFLVGRGGYLSACTSCATLSATSTGPAFSSATRSSPCATRSRWPPRSSPPCSPSRRRSNTVSAACWPRCCGACPLPFWSSSHAARGRSWPSTA
jgi:hypothetical protein